MSEPSLHSVLQTVCDLTRQVIPGDIETSVSLLLADQATTVGYSGQRALALDEWQYGIGYGPCLHAASTGEPVSVTDARSEARRSDYMQRAVELGSLSSLSLPLGGPEQMSAALNIYAGPPDAIGQESRRVGEKLARLAGVAVANMHAYQSAREMADGLQVAMESRAVIEQAKGILIERHRLTADEAFQLLAKASMATNRKLRDIADQLVRTGHLPEPPTHRSGR